MMDGSWMSGSWMGLFGLIWLAIAAFIFGIIFWWTKKLVEKKR